MAVVAGVGFAVVLGYGLYALTGMLFHRPQGR